jgi:hypothetical protein
MRTSLKSTGTWASMEWLKNPEVDKMIDDAPPATPLTEQDL